jgi:hypothetical protein
MMEKPKLAKKCIPKKKPLAPLPREQVVIDLT